MTTRFFVKDSTNFFKVACQARRLSQNTISDYPNTLRKLVAFTGNIPIDQVTRLDIQSLVASQTVCNRTLLNYHTGLSAFNKLWIIEGILTPNSMEGVGSPRPEIRTIDPIPVEHIQQVVAISKSTLYQNSSKTVTNDLQR